MDESFWENFEEEKDFFPWFRVLNGVTYTFEVVDPDAEPRYMQDKLYKNDQWVWDVKLIDISPESALEEKDRDGFPLYEIGAKYSLPLRKRAMKRLHSAWLENDKKPIVKFSMKRFGQGYQTDYIFTLL
ncbi:MAG: hypothetical protein ACTSUK_04025 [Promethearchaeota archaeon]